MPDVFLIVFGAGLGLTFGSFGTVVAHRVPRKENIASGRSRCPDCGHTITALENVPVLSYIFLRGRCRECGQRISPRYPAMELGTAVLFTLAFLEFDFTLEAFVYSFFFWVLIVLSVIDLDTKKLPDVITGPALVVGWVGLVAIAILRGSFGSFSWVSVVGGAGALAIALLSYDLRRKAPGAPAGDPAQKSEKESEKEEDVTTETPAKPKRALALNPLGALLLGAWLILFIAVFFEPTKFLVAGATVGAAIFAGFFFSMVVLYEKGMGLGDAKLGLLLGSFTGFLGSPDLVVAALFFAFVLGGVGGGIHIALGGNRKDAIPFGPFLAMGSAVSIFVGQDLVNLYGNLISG